MRKGRLLFTLLLLAPFLFPTEALAESVDISASQDTYANLAYPDKANGSQQVIIISNNVTTRLGYVEFEDINLPGGAIIDSASLKINVNEVHYADIAKLTVGPIDGDWSEGTASWNNKPSDNTSEAQNEEISITSTGWKNIYITELVRKWVNGSVGNYGLYIYPIDYLYTVAEPPFAFTFKSSNAGGDNPVLHIEYHIEPTVTPEPTETPTPTLEPTTTPTSAPSPTDEPLEDDALDSTIAAKTADKDEVESESDEPKTESEERESKNRSPIVIGLLLFFGLLALAIPLITRIKKQKDYKKKKDKNPSSPDQV